MRLKYQNGFIFEGHTFVVDKTDIRNAKDEQFVEGVALLPEVHGRWIYVPKETDEGCDTWRCSVCGARFVTEFGFEEQSFCAECGAEMDGGEGE